MVDGRRFSSDWFLFVGCDQEPDCGVYSYLACVFLDGGEWLSDRPGCFFRLGSFVTLSFLTHFEAISRGVIDLRDLVYFLALISAWLYASVLVVDMKKAD